MTSDNMNDTNVEVRRVLPKEIDEVLRVEKETWPEEIQAPKEKFESRFENHPKGFLGIYLDEKLVGVSTSHVVDYNWGDDFTWESITDNGYYTNHNPDGNTLYVGSVGVSQEPYVRRATKEIRKNGEPGLGTRLVQGQKELTRELELDQLVLSARVPLYHKHSDMDIDDYLSMKKEGTDEPYDPEIRFYKRLGLEIIKPKHLAMECGDPESRDWGVLMGWRNKP